MGRQEQRELGGLSRNSAHHIFKSRPRHLPVPAHCVSASSPPGFEYYNPSQPSSPPCLSPIVPGCCFFSARANLFLQHWQLALPPKHHQYCPVPRAPLHGSSGHLASRTSMVCEPRDRLDIRVSEACAGFSVPSPNSSCPHPAFPLTPSEVRTRYPVNQSPVSRAPFAPPVYSRWRPAPPARSPLSLRLSKPGRAMTSLL